MLLFGSEANPILSTIIDHHSPQKIIILLHIRKIRPPIIEEEEEEASNEMVKYKIVEASKCYYSGRRRRSEPNPILSQRGGYVEGRAKDRSLESGHRETEAGRLYVRKHCYT